MKFLNTATLLYIAALAISSLTTKNPVSAADVTLTTSKPLSDGIVNIQFTFNNITSTVLVDNIKATDTEQIKRAKISLELFANGFDIEQGPQSITVKNLRQGTKVKFTSISTGEGEETLEAFNISRGFYDLFGGVTGVFDSLDPLGNLSTFLVGFSSTLGEVSLELTSDQFSDLSGETIARTFFNQIVDDADLIGINLSLDNSMILANYDTGIFGTGIHERIDYSDRPLP